MYRMALRVVALIARNDWSEYVQSTHRENVQLPEWNNALDRAYITNYLWQISNIKCIIHP